MIPGQNILNMALSIIAKQTITYFAFTGRVQNVLGQWITQYAAPVNIVGSWQPVPRQLYQTYGLDLQKDYFTFYTSNNLLDLARDVSGDQVLFNGEIFQCESDNDWFALDGWKGVLCVRVGVPSPQPVFGFSTLPWMNGNLNFANGNFYGGS